jgi:hypothetical protein
VAHFFEDFSGGVAVIADFGNQLFGLGLSERDRCSEWWFLSVWYKAAAPVAPFAQRTSMPL